MPGSTATSSPVALRCRHGVSSSASGESPWCGLLRAPPTIPVRRPPDPPLLFELGPIALEQVEVLLLAEPAPCGAVKVVHERAVDADQSVAGMPDAEREVVIFEHPDPAALVT